MNVGPVIRFFTVTFLAVLCALASFAGEVPLVYEVPIEGEIGRTHVYIVRRALREATSNGALGIVLVVNTPGGAVDAMVDIVDALEHYEGTTWAYVNEEALSAGAYIVGACDHIYFSPKGLMGAAAPILATGEDLSETARLKLESFLNAKLRALASGARYRADVLRAMSDQRFVLQIDAHLLKPEGELLTLTAVEATALYGTPPEPLLSDGTVASVQIFLDAVLGKGSYGLRPVVLLGVEHMAQFLQLLTPLLLGLGLLCLFIEFKTPGFGVFGVCGAVFLGLVFVGQYVAGLAGYESAAVLFGGMAFLFISLFLVPGTIILELVGLGLSFGALLWMLSGLSLDALGPESFWALTRGLAMLLTGVAIAITFAFLLGRILPKGLVWDRLVLGTSGKPVTSEIPRPMIGAQGVALTRLVPTGVVDVEGVHYEGRLEVGMAEKGSLVRVIRVESLTTIIVEVI